MGGDGTAQIIAEYIAKQGGFIAFVIIMCSICIAAIIFGIVMSFVTKSKNKKNAAVADGAGEVEVAEVATPVEPEEKKEEVK